MVAKIDFVTDEEYFDLEEGSPTKLELVRGVIQAMAGGSGRHHAIMSNIAGVLYGLFRGRTCRVLNSEVKLRIPTTGTFLHPDAMIACPPNYTNERNGVIDNPVIIFEVLSPSTERFDLGRKLEFYEEVPSVREVVYLASDRVEGRVLARSGPGEGWTERRSGRRSGRLHLPSLELDLPLAELYEDVALPDADL